MNKLSLESLNTRKLANHISEHGSIYTPDVVYGVLEKFRSCLLETLLNSKKVKIEGLGTFYTTLECKKGGGSQTGGETGGGSQTGGGGNDDNNNDAPPVINPDTDHPSDGD